MPKPNGTWRRWGGVFSHERSRCFHLPVFKRKKESRVSSRMAENTRSYKKKIGVGGWGGRAVIGSSHRCDVRGREMKFSSRIAVVIFFFVIASVRMCAKRLVRGACRSAHTAVCLWSSASSLAQTCQVFSLINLLTECNELHCGAFSKLFGTNSVLNIVFINYAPWYNSQLNSRA